MVDLQAFNILVICRTSERIFAVDLQRWNMGRAPCCEKRGLKKGPWTPEEDQILVNYILKNGHGNWRAVPQLAGLPRCSKSCRLRWMNYLRPDIKRGSFTEEEGRTIIQLHGILGSRWSMIASNLPGRTDNEIKNFWNSKLKKRLLKMGLDPSTHKPIEEINPNAPHEYKAWAVRRHKAQWENARLEAEARLSRESLIMSYHTNGSTVETTTMPNNNPPADYFLKMWTSEAGKAFRKENHYDPLLSSVSSENSFGQSLHPDDNVNDVEKDNSSQQCNSASFEWIRDCNVELGFPELPLDQGLQCGTRFSRASPRFFRKENHYPNGGGGDDPLLSSVLSSLDPDDNDNDVEKDNTSQQCNSASFEWIGDCNVQLGFPELPLDQGLQCGTRFSRASPRFFRKENHYPNGGGGDDSVLSSVLSSLHPDDNDNDVEKDNTSQQCNSASFEWIGDCNVETPKVPSFVGNMTKDKATEELGFLELPLDFLDTDDNNANIQSELRKGFQQHAASPLPELLEEDYWSNMSFIAHAYAF